MTLVALFETQVFSIVYFSTPLVSGKGVWTDTVPLPRYLEL